MYRLQMNVMNRMEERRKNRGGVLGEEKERIEDRQWNSY